MDPTFTNAPDRDGIEITDTIENARFALYTPAPVEPTPTAADEFHFPVDSAVAIDTDAIVVPKLANVLVRTQTGDLVADNADHENRSFDRDAYNIELSTAPMKLYLSAESALEVRHDDRSVTVAFDGETEVRVGARSFHDRPAGTVTTTADPVGAMDAISLFGSALKTTSPERSFPTLRGHPPLVEIGDEFDAPEGIERPDTGVRLELPADYEYVYPATSLAYYLGAEAVLGDQPQLVTDEGFEYDLGGRSDYEQTVGRVLRQTFFFDCVTRTEGYYEVDLHEREAVEPLVDLDFTALYDAPLAERLAAYLSVEFDTIAEYVPDWNLTTDVMTTPNNAEVLPFVANDLALVRCPRNPTAASVSPTPEPLDEFFRDRPEPERAADEFTRSTADASDPLPARDEVFNPEPADTIEHAWVGEGFPLGANKATVESYRRRVERSPPEKTSIEIHVVCNDDRMKAEGVVEEFYGLRDLLRFDVSIHYGLSTDELRELLATSADFVHYIGHVDDDGMRCPDGHLDATTLEDVNVKSFVLNACRSYAQGEALVEAGSYGGVVTLSEVANSVATDIGQTLARLLNCGFPLRVALSIVKDTTPSAYQYTTVGDGGLTLCQSESATPTFAIVSSGGNGLKNVEIQSFLVEGYEMGTMQSFTFRDSGKRYLSSGTVTTFEMADEELDEYFNLEVLPVKIDGQLRWSDEIIPAEL